MSQMRNRQNGLIDTGLLEESTRKIVNRKPLVNEFVIDVAGKTPEEVFQDAVSLIENAETKREYTYTPPHKSEFYSWVWGNQLRTK